MDKPLPVLTLWEPWASLIAIGAKPFETRSWATRYRGPIAIHAGGDRRGLALCRGEEPIEAALEAEGLSLDPRMLPLGCIVAVADLIECWPTEAIVADGLADPFGDYGPGRFGWHLARVKRLPRPIPAQGHQGLWPAPVTVRQGIAAQLSPNGRTSDLAGVGGVR